MDRQLYTTTSRTHLPAAFSTSFSLHQCFLSSPHPFRTTLLRIVVLTPHYIPLPFRDPAWFFDLFSVHRSPLFAVIATGPLVLPSFVALEISPDLLETPTPVRATTTMSLPTVALIGGTGLLGSHFTRCFVSALLDSRLAGVVLVSSQPSDAVLSKAGLKYPVSGVKVCTVKYDDKQAIAGALEGVDVLVNTLGAAREGFQGICETVLDAAVDAGIKVSATSHPAVMTEG